MVWQDENENIEATGKEQITPPIVEPHSQIISGSTLEETLSAHEIMGVITPWTEPFLAYLLRQELLDDQTEGRWIVRCSKSYKVHEGEIYRKRTTDVLQ